MNIRENGDLELVNAGLELLIKDFDEALQTPRLTPEEQTLMGAARGRATRLRIAIAEALE